MLRGIKVLVALLSTLLCLPLAAIMAATPTPCTLCILEFQTLGIHGEEDQDFVIVTNRGSSNVTSLQLRYYNVAGVLADSMTLAVGTLNAGTTKAYVSNGLAAANPGVDTLKTMALSSAGGSLQLAKTSSGVTTVFDSVGWGSNTAVKEGQAAPFQAAGTTIARKLVNNVAQDNNDNNTDFVVSQQTCQGAWINEIQPYATDAAGKTIANWVEIVGDGPVKGSCWLVNNLGTELYIDGADMPDATELAVFDGYMDDQGSNVPLQLSETSGTIWLDGMSLYSAVKPVRLPLTSTTYSAMSRGQSWALVDGIWRRTYTPSFGVGNIFTASPDIHDDPLACKDVQVSELLPNPTGEDTGNEWVELHNLASQLTNLGSCQVTIAGQSYGFLADDMLAPGEWRMVDTFFNSDVPVSVSLKNTDTTIVELQRVVDGNATTLQSFSYVDAPEGQAWARFDDGWRWMSPTPSLDNATPPEVVATGLTEQAAESGAVGEGQSGQNGGQTPSSSTQTTLKITELFPNPAAPQSDDADEYVELYNSGSQSIDLSGYKIQVGDSYSYSHTFEGVSIAPGQYLAVTSGQSTLSLANSSGRARLLAPDGGVLSETDPYQNAPAGQAWALVDGKWQWTGAPTAAAGNTFVAPQVKSATTKKAAVKKEKAATVKKATATKKAAPKAKKDNKAAASGFGSKLTDAPRLHIAVLAAVGILAVLYAAYEYRQDIISRMRQFRTNRSLRPTARQAFARR